MGHRELRRLLIIGASAVVRWATRRRDKDKPVACPHAGAQTADAGHHGACQQNGTHRLGADGEWQRSPAQPWNGGDGLTHVTVGFSHRQFM